MIIVIVAEVQALIIQVVLAIVILDLLVLEMITVVGQAHLAEAKTECDIHNLNGGWTDEKGNEYNDYYDPNTEIFMIPMEIIKEI